MIGHMKALHKSKGLHFNLHNNINNSCKHITNNLETSLIVQTLKHISPTSLLKYH